MRLFLYTIACHIRKIKQNIFWKKLLQHSLKPLQFSFYQAHNIIKVLVSSGAMMTGDLPTTVKVLLLRFVCLSVRSFYTFPIPQSVCPFVCIVIMLRIRVYKWNWVRVRPYFVQQARYKEYAKIEKIVCQWCVVYIVGKYHN